MDGVCIWRTETDGVCAWSAEINGICVRRTLLFGARKWMAYVSAERKWIAYMEMCARPFVNKKLFLKLSNKNRKNVDHDRMREVPKLWKYHAKMSRAPFFRISLLHPFFGDIQKKQISHSTTPTFEARSYGGENDSMGVRVKNDSERSVWRTIVKTTETSVNTTPISPRPLSCTGVIGISWHFNWNNEYHGVNPIGYSGPTGTWTEVRNSQSEERKIPWYAITPGEWWFDL